MERVKRYGLGSQFGVMLPFSRNHETKTKSGLTLMAIAGYNPEES
jgi:hypothetical protein